MFLNHTPALILTENELIDNSSMQTVKWSDIKEISFQTISRGPNYIGVLLKDPTDFIISTKSPFKRFILKLNHRFFGGTLSIQPMIIKCDADELYDTLVSYQREASIH